MEWQSRYQKARDDPTSSPKSYSITPAGEINNARDYPTPPGGRQVRRGHDVVIELTVGTSGRVTACRITDPSPDPEADAITCRLATERFVFRPRLNASATAASLVESPVPDAIGLKLTPKRPEPQYDYFIVATTQPGLQIRGLATHDRQGGDSVIAFTNLKENQGISDNEFAFRIPKGADVITNGGN